MIIMTSGQDFGLTKSKNPLKNIDFWNPFLIKDKYDMWWGYGSSLTKSGFREVFIKEAIPSRRCCRYPIYHRAPRWTYCICSMVMVRYQILKRTPYILDQHIAMRNQSIKFTDIRNGYKILSLCVFTFFHSGHMHRLQNQHRKFWNFIKTHDHLRSCV